MTETLTTNRPESNADRSSREAPERGPAQPDCIILGGGSVTAVYYLPALRWLGLADRTVVVDPDESSTAALRGIFPDARFATEDYRRFLGGLPAAGEERIVIALPNRLHVEAVELALGCGRHVLCEKPLSLRASDCRQLRTAADRAGMILKVAMSWRYMPSLMLAQEMVNARELGSLISVDMMDCAPFAWRPKSFSFFAPEAGGVLADMGVHYLDYVQMLLGALEPVSYEDDSRGCNEASLAYRLRAGDVPVMLRLSRLHPAGSVIRLQCERGEIRIEKKHERDVLVQPTNGLQRRVSAENPFADPAWPRDFHGGFCAMLADFNSAIQGREVRLAGAADAEKTAALIEWAYERRNPRFRPSISKTAAAEVLITGATGFIGSHLVERLAVEGQSVRAAVRSPASCANIARYPLQIAPVDLLDPRAVKNVMSGVRKIFHLAFGREGRNAARVTIEGTRNVVEAAIAAEAEAVVVLSTMYVFGFPSGAAVVDESFPYRPYGGEYGTSKAAMERWCLERAKTSGKTRIVVLNPTCVFGPGGSGYTVIPVELARQGQFCWIEGGSGICNFTYVGNLIDAIIAAATSDAAHGQRFIINDGFASWRDFLGPLLAPLNPEIADYALERFRSLTSAGSRFRLRDVASAALRSGDVRAVIKRSRLARRIIASVPEEHALRRRSQRQGSQMLANPGETCPPGWLADLYGPAQSVFSAAKAQRVLNWFPAVGYDAARDRTISWLAETGYYAARGT